MAMASYACKTPSAAFVADFSSPGKHRCSHLRIPRNNSSRAVALMRSPAGLASSQTRALTNPLRSTFLSGRNLLGAGRALGCSRQVKKKNLRVVEAKGSTVDAVDRLVSAVSYFLPLFDGIQYGRYLFMQFPLAEQMVEPLFPILRVYKSFPYASFVAFFVLYLTVVRNQSFSRYVRFNAMQAVVLDVLTIVPHLVERIFGPATGGLGYNLLVSFYNTVYLFLIACFVYGVACCVLGRTPRLPFVADAADAQM